MIPQLFLLFTTVFAQYGQKGHPFRTEPQLRGQLVDIQEITPNRTLLSPGYLFFSPVNFLEGWGPQIYDIDGLLIWDGELISNGIVQQFHACDHAGKRGEHLCWHEASALGTFRLGQNNSKAHDYNRVFDNSYTQIGPNYTTTGELTTKAMKQGFVLETKPSDSDSHEFHIVGNGETYVQTVYPRRQTDLSPWLGAKDGWISESCFQDIRLKTEEIVFSWCYLDHLALETNVYVKGPKQTNFTTNFGGDGSFFHPWDYFHINSVDKNEESDYLISGRHADQIIKLAGPDSPNGKPGELLWRLGGPSNQFEMQGGFTFTRQHHVRYVSTGADWTYFTVFDNAWEGETPKNATSQPYSSGKLIAINNSTMVAKLVQEYAHPDGKRSRSGGSIQMLPNKNIFVGWGFIREITEFSYDGKVLMHAKLKNADEAGVFNYRNFKAPWVGRPAAAPKLLAYSRNCTETPLMAYVSWNGATEVTRWEFFTSASSKGPWDPAKSFDKTSFETGGKLSSQFMPYVLVKAYDKDGQILNSVSKQTFVPRPDRLEECDNKGCTHNKTFSYAREDSDVDRCITLNEPSMEQEKSPSKELQASPKEAQAPVEEQSTPTKQPPATTKQPPATATQHAAPTKQHPPAPNHHPAPPKDHNAPLEKTKAPPNLVPFMLLALFCIELCNWLYMKLVFRCAGEVFTRSEGTNEEKQRLA